LTRRRRRRRRHPITAFAVHTARTKFADMLAELESYEKASVATDFT
jgi:hypothetical protein